jgi:hypothetical protein
MSRPAWWIFACNRTVLDQTGITSIAIHEISPDVTTIEELPKTVQVIVDRS